MRRPHLGVAVVAVGAVDDAVACRARAKRRISIPKAVGVGIVEEGELWIFIEDAVAVLVGAVAAVGDAGTHVGVGVGDVELTVCNSVPTAPFAT